MKVSIVTGTLNRKHLLPIIIRNTVQANPDLELVLVDGGSEDGTQEHIKKLKHPRIKFIEVGGRSTYPHYMNLGIKESSCEWVVVWNDDVTLINNWKDVIALTEQSYDVFVFVWRKGNITKRSLHGEFIHYCNWKNEMVLNYGMVNKRIFRKLGMYNHAYKYYCADGDILYRFWKYGAKITVCNDIRVVTKENEEKRAVNYKEDFAEYDKRAQTYAEGHIPETVEFLK